jgi:hypothetical protein
MRVRVRALKRMQLQRTLGRRFSHSNRAERSYRDNGCSRRPCVFLKHGTTSAEVEHPR